jgi:hypothetical protein
MAPKSVHVVQEDSFNALQTRIERLAQAKIRLLDEWSLAMKRIYPVPGPDRDDALRIVGDRYGDAIGVLEAHIMTLKTTRGDATPRIEHLLMHTGRPGTD